MKLLVSINITELHKEMQPHYLDSCVRRILITSIQQRGEGRKQVGCAAVPSHPSPSSGKAIMESKGKSLATVPKGLNLEVIGDEKPHNPMEEALGKWSVVLGFILCFPIVLICIMQSHLNLQQGSVMSIIEMMFFISSHNITCAFHSDERPN